MFKTTSYVIILPVVISFPLLFLARPVSGQPTSRQAPADKKQQQASSNEARKGSAKEEATIATLSTIVQYLDDAHRLLREKNRDLRAAETREDKENISDQIAQLNNNLKELEINFDKIATGIDILAFEEKPEKKFNLKDELLLLLEPIIKELKSMTARPRQLEKLRNEVAYYKQRIPVVKKAIASVQRLSAEAEDKNLQRHLVGLEEKWKNKGQQISNQLAVANIQLEEISREQKSVLESTQDILQRFFRSRGRNLFFAVLSFVSVVLILNLLYRLIYRLSPIHKFKQRPFYLRVCDVTYHFLTLFSATIALLIVLYVSGDWVLLSLMIILLLGVAWTAKRGLPQFWEQIKILLNLSTVREHERLIYNGIPWRVASLSLYTQLENPELKSSKIRLPLKSLLGLNSRPYHKDEPWFPCKEKDWVILADGTWGKVMTQTHEMVQLVLRGGSHKTYLTEEFLRLNPMNISTNFRLKVTFGVDYEHQAICTREVPDKMTRFIADKLTEAGYGDDLINLNVDFKAAASSSLDLEIIADFSGKAAHSYNDLERALNKFAVDACNRYGWVIPFTQVTVHTAESTSER